MSFKRFVAALALFCFGVACGGYLFAKSEPRSFLAFADCRDRCYKPNDLAGLITSAGILRAPFLVPGVVLESDTCLAIRHPWAQATVHYVLFPKRDVRDVASITPEDIPFVLGCFALARQLVVRDKLSSYRLSTNGPERQEITYLHFHLLSE